MNVSSGRRSLGLAAFGLAMAFAGSAIAADKQVVMYSANDDTVNTMVATAFTKATGIKVNVISAGSGLLYRRIAAESGNPQADVIWGTSADLLKQNKQHFQPYAAKERDAVPAAYRDPDNLWIGTNLQILTINQNTQSIPAADGPKSWEDLLNSKWKGKLAYTNPANSGSSYVTATYLISLWGDNEAAWKKFGALIANAKVLSRSTLVFNGNGNGEFPLGISLEYAGYLWAHNGAPVKVTYPTDGTVVLPEGIAIIKGAPNLDAAKQLVDFIESKPMEEELLRKTFRRPARQDLDLSGVKMTPLSQIKIGDYDNAKWNAARGKTLDHLRTIIQNSR